MKLFVCGDIINQFSHKQFVGSSLIEYIKNADHAICNFEGCIAEEQEKRSMLQDPSTLASLIDAGFDTLLLANNHICDYGKQKLNDTITKIEEYNLHYIGAGISYERATRPLILDGKVGIMNLCEAHPHYYSSKDNDFGYAWIGDPNVPSRIMELKKTVEFLIVFVHAGLEHYTCPLKYLRSFYRQLCDMGTDAVIAAHPHIAQGLEYYGDKLICYSLGNFYFPRSSDANSTDIENSSYSLLLNIDNSTVSYEVIYHQLDNLMVDYVPDDEAKVNVEELSSMLSTGRYEVAYRSTIDTVYNKLVKQLYKGALHTIRPEDSFVRKTKDFIRYALLSKEYVTQEKKTFVHLLNNETYRSIVNAYFEKEYEGRQQ